jgi:hypothetical protein
MDPLRLICEQDGFFTRALARDVGYSDKAVTAAVRAGAWHRFRRGYYSYADIWSTLDDTEKHRVRSRAVLHSLGPDVALSHSSRLVAHGIDTSAIPLDQVHVTRLGADSSRIEGDVVHHHGNVGVGDVVVVDGMQVMSAARCAVEHASRSTGESGLVSFESALHLRKVTRTELFAQFERLGSWPGMRHVHVPIRLANGKSHSVGEARGFWLMWAARLPKPQRQHEIRATDDALVATCDWGWPELDVYGEFDGIIKYGRLLKPDQGAAGDVIFAEKQREDRIRELTGGSMVRLVWADFGRPRVTIARLERHLRRDKAG